MDLDFPRSPGGGTPADSLLSDLGMQIDWTGASSASGSNSAPSATGVSEWDVDLGLSDPTVNGPISVSSASDLSPFNPLVGVEPMTADLSPSKLFAGGPTGNFESLYSGIDGGLTGLDALTAAQSLYASPAVDPFAHFKKSAEAAASTGLKPAPISVPLSQFATLRGSLVNNNSNNNNNNNNNHNNRNIPIASNAAAPKPPAALVPTTAAGPLANIQFPAFGNGLKGQGKQTAIKPIKRKKTGAPSEDVLALRRKKHNEIEIRRRQRLNDNFEELQQLIQYSKKEKDKDSVLRGVIDKLREYNDQLATLEKEHKARLGSLASVPRGIKLSAQLFGGPTAGALSTPAVNSKVNHSKVFVNNNVPMAVANLHGKLVDANDRFLEVLGYTMSELRDLPCVQLTHPEDLPNLFRHLNDLLTGRITSFTSLKRLLTRNRQYVHFNHTVWVVKELGQPRYLMGIFIPVHIDAPLTAAQLAALPRPQITCK